MADIDEVEEIDNLDDDDNDGEDNDEGGEDSGGGGKKGKKSGTGKPLGLIGTLVKHNTTIIAVILGISSIICSMSEKKAAAAQEEVTEITSKIEENTKSLEQDGLEIDELETKRLADSLTETDADQEAMISAKYDSLIEKYNKKIATTNDSEEVYNNKLKKDTDDLDKDERIKDANQTAKTIFEFSILISSIGITNKRKVFSYTAIATTIIGILTMIIMSL